ncbi:MAG: hypothetical protein EHM55_20485 [Acidobacteria bacterium]|nr:MAG: hypothetical protein EHM55_20485 [Acidobacteriota bacterium]
MRLSPLAGSVVCLLLSWPAFLAGEPVAVRVAERAANTPLVLRSLSGTALATGESIQTVRAGQVTSRVVFRFTDGSLHDETCVFSQNDVFRLLSYRLSQKGPSFRWALDMTIDTQTGRVVVRHADRAGEEEVEDEKLDLASDVANGMMVTVLKNLGARAQATASFVAATPEPRPVKLAISSAGSEPVSLAGSSGRAAHYVIKAEIGGLAGVLAPLVGRQPPDTHVWILEGASPSFVKSEGPLFYGGPIWRIELAR